MIGASRCSRLQTLGGVELSLGPGGSQGLLGGAYQLATFAILRPLCRLIKKLRFVERFCRPDAFVFVGEKPNSCVVYCVSIPGNCDAVKLPAFRDYSLLCRHFGPPPKSALPLGFLPAFEVGSNWLDVDVCDDA